jgi:hypothetical protein
VPYVVDAPALVSVPLQAPDPADVFTSMVEFVKNNELCYANEVVDELGRTARGEQPLMWAQACAGNRCNRGAAYNYAEWVGHDFPDIVDTTARDTQESAAPYVVAQALELRDAGLEVTVVTEDVHRKPTRASVREACEHFELRCITLGEFLAETGLD